MSSVKAEHDLVLRVWKIKSHVFLIPETVRSSALVIGVCVFKRNQPQCTYQVYPTHLLTSARASWKLSLFAYRVELGVFYYWFPPARARASCDPPPSESDLDCSLTYSVLTCVAVSKLLRAGSSTQQLVAILGRGSSVEVIVPLTKNTEQ